MISTLANKTHDNYGFFGFNATQCEIDWKFREFLLDVDAVKKTISVTTSNETDWPDYGDAFLANLTSKLAAFTYNDGSFGGSMLGRAMRMNTDNLNWTMHQTGSETEMATEDILLRSLEDFITYAFDSSIIAMASSLAVLTNATIPVNATVSVQAIVYGSAGYVYSIFAINAVICLVYAAEALRTRGWGLISPVDFLDMATLVVAASRGGSGIAESFEQAVKGDTEGKGRRAIGTLKVQPRVFTFEDEGLRSSVMWVKLNDTIRSFGNHPI
ncbi:hypothetical protein SLS58_011286 [Diplodia intermedia]|uniref:Uncharacterized protein n=1 Tax=Diplodia intermedia TaxID=856260 RepID=A0ABR3SZZ1_9PEZI